MRNHKTTTTKKKHLSKQHSKQGETWEVERNYKMFANPVFINPWRYVCKAILYGRWNEKKNCFLRVHMNPFKRFRAFQIELEFGSVGFWGEGKTGVPREKPLGARQRTNNKLNPQFPDRLLVLDSSDLWIGVEIDDTVSGCADTSETGT